MSAPDKTILEILIRNTLDGDTDPFAATAELSNEYRFHPEWVDRHKCAATDIENYKKRYSFKPGGEEEHTEFYSIVVLGEGKERRWSFRGHMDRRKILQRIHLVQKKDREHHEAAKQEIAYWRGQM